MSHTVSTLLLRNLHDVFGEIDPGRRRTAIDEIFNTFVIPTMFAKAAQGVLSPEDLAKLINQYA